MLFLAHPVVNVIICVGLYDVAWQTTDFILFVQPCVVQGQINHLDANGNSLSEPRSSHADSTDTSSTVLFLLREEENSSYSRSFVVIYVSLQKPWGEYNCTQL